MNTTFYSSPSFICTLLYPHYKSIFINTFLVLMFSTMSKIKDNRQLFFIVHSFKYLQFYIIHFLLFFFPTKIQVVVATTCRNSTRSLLTSTKLSVDYLVVEITRELDKEPSLHCSSIYIIYKQSVLQQYVYLMSYYSSTMLLPQGYHAISMCPNIILFNLHHHACTICTP